MWDAKPLDNRKSICTLCHRIFCKRKSYLLSWNHSPWLNSDRMNMFALLSSLTNAIFVCVCYYLISQNLYFNLNLFFFLSKCLYFLILNFKYIILSSKKKNIGDAFFDIIYSCCDKRHHFDDSYSNPLRYEIYQVNVNWIGIHIGMVESFVHRKHTHMFTADWIIVWFYCECIWLSHSTILNESMHV